MVKCVTAGMRRLKTHPDAARVGSGRAPFAGYRIALDADYGDVAVVHSIVPRAQGIPERASEQEKLTVITRPRS
ncbi:hypothetical protein ABZ297_04020 [Nonomuraea sp. NPDC005983]|uniref:hypothetical protein n=1 Tax=Nonomuraea sp. NPDC005983 TaxID=3155595 RepID=UPI0033A92931